MIPVVRAAALLSCYVFVGCEQPAVDTQDNGSVANDTMISAAGVTFDTATAHLITSDDRFTLNVELAERSDQQTVGLMDRDALADDAGMVFLYDTPQSPQAGFWMYRTRIPLDIAFFDGAGKIGAILQMEPCRSMNRDVCRIYQPGVSYFGALEVNRGYFERHGVEVGDRIVVPGRVGG